MRPSPRPFVAGSGNERRPDAARTYCGPTNRAFAALDAEKGAALEAEIAELLGRMNRGGEGALIVPSEYLEVVVTKA